MAPRRKKTTPKTDEDQVEEIETGEEETDEEEAHEVDAHDDAVIVDESPVTTPEVKQSELSLPESGSVLLRYNGESPVRALNGVPSLAKYKIVNGFVRVYVNDAKFLLANKDFQLALQ